MEGEHVRAQEGTGLGLALVKALTAMHGGDAAISSVLGEGTTVRCRLPYAAVSAASASRPTLRTAGGAQGRCVIARLKAGIFVRALIRRAEVAGAQAYVARHGAEEAGAIVIKIARLDGTCLVLVQARRGEGELVWVKPLGDSADEARAEAFSKSRSVSIPICGSWKSKTAKEGRSSTSRWCDRNTPIIPLGRLECEVGSEQSPR